MARLIDHLLPDDPMERARLEAYMREVRVRLKRQVPVLCAWRRCVYYVDPLSGKTNGGMGAVGCGCDNLPGWRSPYMAGKPKPSVPAKAKGRHGSRVQRSKRRKASWRRWVRELGL